MIVYRPNLLVHDAPKPWSPGDPWTLMFSYPDLYHQWRGWKDETCVTCEQLVVWHELHLSRRCLACRQIHLTKLWHRQSRDPGYPVQKRIMCFWEIGTLQMYGKLRVDRIKVHPGVISKLILSRTLWLPRTRNFHSWSMSSRTKFSRWKTSSETTQTWYYSNHESRRNESTRCFTLHGSK